jgi:hypothetical protein
MAAAHDHISLRLFLFPALRTSNRFCASQEEEQGQLPPFLSFPELHADHKNPAHRATNIGSLPRRLLSSSVEVDGLWDPISTPACNPLTLPPLGGG